MNHKRKVKVLLVTPEMAERWLNECNTHNRPIRNHVVEKYAEAMKRGEWKLTSEPIAFSRPYIDAEGKSCRETLLNGQHRLWGVINSGRAVEMTVWWGCEPDEFDVIDQGATRTFGDVLATTRNDLADPTLVASICSSAARFGFGYSSHHGALRQAHITSMLKHLEPEIVAVVGYKKTLRKYAPRTVLGPLLMTRIVNPGMADMIVNQLKDAIGFTERDPIRALHLYLTDLLSSTSKDTPDTQCYKVCHALAARLRGDHIRVLRLTGEGIGWLRDATRSRISPVVTSLYSGKVPHNFYNPKLMAAETEAAS
jgi:hypothetical protein